MQAEDIHGICNCTNCEPRGTNPRRPTWYWCKTLARQVAPRHCGDHCPSYKPQPSNGGTEQRMAAKNIRWDDSARLTVDGAGDAPLWAWAREQIRLLASAESIARQIGVSSNSLRSAIAKRECQDAPTADAEPTPKRTPATAAPRVCAAPITQGAEPVQTGCAPPEPHYDAMDFIRALGLAERFEGFVMARQLDRNGA